MMQVSFAKFGQSRWLRVELRDCLQHVRATYAILFESGIQRSSFVASLNLHVGIFFNPECVM